MQISKKRYIQFFCVVVVVLGWAKEIFPSIYLHDDNSKPQKTIVVRNSSSKLKVEEKSKKEETPERIAEKENNVKFHRIYSVSSFKNSFPDQNDVQLIAAEKNGIKPMNSRSAIKNNTDKLVYIGNSQYYYIDRMRNSSPYLVPKAAVLLNDIGYNFLDSLQIKGIPLHKIIVTSVLRTNEDVAKLQKRNMNAAEKSCHQYGTTVDICYNRYKTIADPDGPSRREVRNDSLKWVLSEVLNDMRKQGRCYIKYEVKQGCFHITVR